MNVLCIGPCILINYFRHFATAVNFLCTFGFHIISAILDIELCIYPLFFCSLVQYLFTGPYVFGFLLTAFHMLMVPSHSSEKLFQRDWTMSPFN